MSRRPSRSAEPNVCYVVPENRADSVQHFAHIPRLLRALVERIRVAALVERGDAVDVAGVEPVVVLDERSLRSPRRLVAYVHAARRFRAAGYDTYFVRYSRMATTVLVLTRPWLKHRIIFWSSGQADMRDPEGERVQLWRRVKHGWNRWILHSVDRVVTGPETMVTYMQQRWNLPPDHVQLLYNDVDTERFAPVPEASRQALRSQYGWRDDEFVVLTVHWLAFRRGSRLLVPAFEKFVAGGVAGARFVIAGAGPDLERVRREAADSSLASSIEVLGAIPNRELPDLYRAADCFLMPSYEEGFPRVLLEAMATELPLVTTTAGGSADVVGSDYPYIVPTGDVDVIAHALADVHALGGDARVDIGRALRLRVEQHFSTDRVADMFVRLLT